MTMRDHLAVPVVRLEVEYMKHSILHAFAEHSAKIDTDVRAAVERFCTVENVRAIVGDAVDRALKAAIEEEINRFYRYGAGREFIKRAVAEKLDGKP